MKTKKRGNEHFIIIGLLLIILVSTLINTLILSVPEKTNTLESLNDELSNQLEEFEQINRITYISSEVLQSAENNELLKQASVGDYYIEYESGVLVYSPENNEIIEKQEYESAPSDLIQKFLAHNINTTYRNQQPDVVKITEDNILELARQIEGLKKEHLGSYVLAYPDMVYLYDYNSDEVLAELPLNSGEKTVPEDLLDKLYEHQEMQEYTGTTPEGLVATEQNIQQLSSQGIDAEIGDYILQYPDTLVVYDYKKDKIKEITDLS